MDQRQYISPSFRAKLMLTFGWTLCMPMRPISSIVSSHHIFFVNGNLDHLNDV